jgi:hypothetical protein
VPARESLILDGVELNDLTSDYVLRSIDFPVPKKRYEWVTGADADGAWLVRDPLFENRTIPMSLRVAQQATMDQALAKIAVLVGKLEEAEQQPDGLPLVWTPANSTKSITFHVLTGEVDGIPVTRDGADRGWLRNYPIVNLTLTCRPFGYGALVSAAASASGSTPLITVDVASVAGDVPAEGTIVVTDLASKSRRDALWGLEQRYYTPGGGAAPLTLAAGSLVTTGFAGTAGTLAGAYLSNVITASAADQPTAICGTGNQPHIGTYRVRARVQAGSVAARFRLAWQDGDGPFSTNPPIAVPAAGGWCEIDLGPITIEPSALGAQRWTGRVEAYTTDGAAQTVYVNLLELIPAGEGYGRARAAYAYKSGVVVAREDFSGFTSGNLNGRTAPAGGAWATAGDATDFAGQPVGSSPTSDFGAGAVVRQVRRHPERAARVLQPERAAAHGQPAAGQQRVGRQRLGPDRGPGELVPDDPADRVRVGPRDRHADRPRRRRHRDRRRARRHLARARDRRRAGVREGRPVRPGRHQQPRPLLRQVLRGDPRA